MELADEKTIQNRNHQFLRLTIGLILGLVIGLINKYYIDPLKINPPDSVFWPMIAMQSLAVIAFVFWASVSVLPPRKFVVWPLVLGAAFAGLLYYAQNSLIEDHNGFYFWILPLIFVVHELFVGASIGKKAIAPYEIYFEETWKRATQLVIAAVFTIAFWGILWLGAFLMKMIGLNWFETLIRDVLFAPPATGIAIAASVNLSDNTPKILNSFRNLILSVFSWLLPLIVLVGMLFAGSLLLTGLDPLFKTKSATGGLLWACLVLVLLSNAAYRDGKEVGALNIAIKFAMRISSVLVLIFSAIAFYALSLRIGQYGLSSARIFAGFGIISAFLFGLGYFIANFSKSNFMGLVRKTNVYLSYFMALVVFLFLTPILDPTKLSVNSQVKRLENGKVTSEKFDWAAMRFKYGIYGKAALEKLAKNPKFAAHAKKIIAKTPDDRYDLEKSPEEDFYNIDASRFRLAKGVQLPESFLKQEFEPFKISGPECLQKVHNNKTCAATLIDLNHDNKPEIAVYGNESVVVFYQKNEVWNASTNIYPDNYDILEITDEEFFKATAVRPNYDWIRMGNSVTRTVIDDNEDLKK